jgi:hypothetical protein
MEITTISGTTISTVSSTTIATTITTTSTIIAGRKSVRSRP